MSKTDHARTPRYSYYWRLRDRRAVKPVVPKRVAIAEQVAAMLEDLDDTQAHFAVPVRRVVLRPEVFTSDGWDDEEPDCGTYDDEQDWTRPHPQDFSDAHCRECEECAHQHALTHLWPNPEEEGWRDDAQDEDPGDLRLDEPWLPLMSYPRLVAELGDGFMVTGPNVYHRPDWPTTPKQGYMRVYELARLVELPSHAVIALLRLRGEYVACHQSWIAQPAARDFRESLTEEAAA